MFKASVGLFRIGVLAPMLWNPPVTVMSDRHFETENKIKQPYIHRSACFQTVE